jgi:hypothetical protein
MHVRGHRALVIGCHGGVGSAVLALLQHSGPGRRLREQIEILLLDRDAPRHPVPLAEAVLLSPASIDSAGDLARLLREHRITQVIDLSSIDTVDCTRVCDEFGADFLCTSVEEWSGPSSIATDEAIARLLPPLRPALQRQSHLVGSGANPGIVNALVFSAIDEFARRMGLAATAEALHLDAILITEEDTTVATDEAASSDVFAMTWSPVHCLEELFEPRAFAARAGRVVGLGHPPTARWYEARCGDHLITGMSVPHEEIATLGRRLPSLEVGFIYRIPDSARRALAGHPERTNAAAWPIRRLYPPWTVGLTGSDRVGVLLCSRRFGELWMGFDTDVTMGLASGTNATQLQVAAGVLSGWSQLGRHKGIHFVEDLNNHEFVSIATEILGRPLVVHDESAPARLLSDRVRTTVFG